MACEPAGWPREKFRPCRVCGELKPVTALDGRRVCDGCGETAPRYYRRWDGSFVELVDGVDVWCVDCEWETTIEDCPVDTKEKVWERARKAAFGHIGNSDGCESYDLGRVGDSVGVSV